MRWQRDAYLITDDKALADLDYITAGLNSTYWAKDRSREVVAQTLERSDWLFLFHADRPAGFARLTGDRCTVAYLGDVFIDPAHRGRGLGRWLVECLLATPAAQVEHLLLGTRDAQGLYEKFGFFRREMMTKYVTATPPDHLAGAANRG